MPDIIIGLLTSLKEFGKKYQWIAFHEILARIADNFAMRKKPWHDSAPKYEGPWQLDIRDIDPSLLVSQNPIRSEDERPPWWDEDFAGFGILSEEEKIRWLETASDCPSPECLIVILLDRAMIPSGFAWTATMTGLNNCHRRLASMIVRGDRYGYR